LLISGPGGGKDFVIVRKFCQQAVYIFGGVQNLPSFFSATSRRDSDMAIMGRKRTNNTRSVRNNPMLPKKVAQSQTVGLYMPHAEGVKSRCKLTTTITNRS